MSRIGSFEREFKKSVRTAEDGDVLAKWEDEHERTVSVMYRKDWAMDDPEYWVSCSDDAHAGAAGDELYVPNGNGLSGTYEGALASARELMRALTNGEVSVQELTV